MTKKLAYEIIYNEYHYPIEGPFDSVEDIMNHADFFFEDGATINIYELSLVKSGKPIQKKVVKEVETTVWTFD